MELAEIQIRQFVRAIMPKLYELQALYNWINDMDSKKPYEQQHQRGHGHESIRIKRLRQIVQARTA